jgi:ferredoxin
MCEFCTRHGDGLIWYKNSANYARDLLSDLNRRKYINRFFDITMKDGFETLGRIETLYRKKGRLPGSFRKMVENKAKIEHFGQVLPLEEIRDLVTKADTIVRMPCACRWTAQKIEERCCYGIAFGADPWYSNIDMSYFGKAPDAGLEQLAKEEALLQMDALEETGAIHTIWTLMTPFIGAICNCSFDGCLALRTLSGIRVETLARAEYAARVDEDRCIGCGLCQSRCQFNAITAELKNKGPVAVIEINKCFGCGLCRKACGVDAISLKLRE